MPKEIDLTRPRWDQSTYPGRAIHFLNLTNPLNLLATPSQLEEAKKVVTEYKKTKVMPPGMDEDKLWKMKYLYDSAFHPDTGNKMVLIGRMSAQAPMNTMIIGCMITFYKSRFSSMFWQWTNQTFNAIVNYTNRSGPSPITKQQLLASYVCACGGAMGIASFLNAKAKTVKNPLAAALVPFAAVAGANFINIPMMRSKEIISGTPVATDTNDEIGFSRRAARLGVFLVCISRVAAASPGLTVVPMLTDFVRRRGLFIRYPRGLFPWQLSLVAIIKVIVTPLCCAIFSQRMSFPVSALEPNLKEIAQKKHPNVTHVYFNKGL